MNQIITKRVDTVRATLERMKPQFELALPKHLTVDRLLRVIITACQNNPRLLECDLTSLCSAAMSCAQLGLEPDGVLGQAYLIPFKNKVQFIAGYKGLITLARNSGEVSTVYAHVVRENDHFYYEYGSNKRLEHKPAKKNRGDIIGFYSFADFTDGSNHFEYLSNEEVLEIRDDSLGWKAFQAGRAKESTWNSKSGYVEMGRKTLIRRIAKYLPLSVQRAVEISSLNESGKIANISEEGGIVIDEVPMNREIDGSTNIEKFENLQKERIEKQAPEIIDHEPETGEVIARDPDRASIWVEGQYKIFNTFTEVSQCDDWFMKNQKAMEKLNKTHPELYSKIYKELNNAVERLSPQEDFTNV